mmetsp:Transcript_40167/g.84080  ORF Transcript_40167/g.84080 Transcript_40167/m.84080 type:complete len:634 (-) Transcript_40167:677-2578(-)
MIPCKHHAPPPPIDTKTHTGYRMQSVREVERRPLKSQRLPNNRRFVPVTVPQQGRAQRAQCGILSYKTLVYRGSRDDHHGTPRENLLKRPGVVIRVTVREDDADDGTGSDALAFQRRRGVGGRIDHDSPAVDPEDVAGGGTRLVEAVRVPEDSDAEGGGVKGGNHDGRHGHHGGVLGELAFSVPERIRLRILVQSDDADAFADADIPREPGFAYDNVVFVNVVQDIIGPAGHFEYLHALSFVLGNLIIRCVRWIDLRHVPNPPNLRIRQPLWTLFLHPILRHCCCCIPPLASSLPIVPIVVQHDLGRLPLIPDNLHFYRSIVTTPGSTMVVTIVVRPIIVVVLIAIVCPSPNDNIASTTTATINITIEAAAAAFGIDGGSAQIIPKVTIGSALEMTEFEEGFEDEFFAVGHDAKVLEFLLEVGTCLAGEVGCKVLLLILQRLLPPKLRRTQQRLAEHPPNIPLGIHAVHDQCAPLPLHEEIKIRRKFELGQIHAQRRTHLPAESIDGDDVHGGDGDPESHGILDGLGGYAELNVTDGLGLDGDSSSGEFDDFEEGDFGFVGLVDFGSFVLIVLVDGEVEVGGHTGGGIGRRGGRREGRRGVWGGGGGCTRFRKDSHGCGSVSAWRGGSSSRGC